MEPQVEALVANGDLASAYDLAAHAIDGGQPTARLRYLAVLALARMGSTRQATEAYDRHGLAALEDVDAAALRARLLKDAAFELAPSGRGEPLKRAAEQYLSVYRRTGDPFPGVNAATLFALAAEATTSRTIAGEVLQRLVDASATSYWSHATRAEALLLLGRYSEAAHALAKARAMPDATPGAVASTRRQLARLAAKDAAIGTAIPPFSVGSVVHFCGKMFMSSPRVEGDLSVRIRQSIKARQVIAGYGGLACGSDILIAESLLAMGAALCVVLSSDPESFRKYSVDPGGSDWAERFHACLERAESVTIAGERSYATDPSSYAYSSRLAMGLAVTRARNLDAEVFQLAVHDGAPASGPAGTAADVAEWRAAGRETVVIGKPRSVRSPAHRSIAREGPERRPASLLFADFAGFTRLAEADLPGFWRDVMGAMAACIDRRRNALMYANTWGDACFAAFDDPVAAGRVALDFQEACSPFAKDGSGMRTSLHHGLVFQAEDPILRRAGVFGQSVSRAARIEPVTPPGTIYVSESFAAAAAHCDPEAFRFDYLGRLPLAKSYGVERLYRLSAPAV